MQSSHLLQQIVWNKRSVQKLLAGPSLNPILLSPHLQGSCLHIHCSQRPSLLFSVQGASCGLRVGVTVVDAIHFLFCDYIKGAIVRLVTGVWNWEGQACTSCNKYTTTCSCGEELWQDVKDEMRCLWLSHYKQRANIKHLTILIVKHYNKGLIL